MKRTGKPKKQLLEEIKKPRTQLKKGEKRLRIGRTDESDVRARSNLQGSETIGGHMERSEVERRLLESNERMVNILESISDGFFSLDNQMVVTYYNRAAENLLGRTRAQVIGEKLSDAFPEAKGSVFERNYAEAIRDKNSMTFEVPFDVKPFEGWYAVRVFPFKDGISVYFQVTTERKEIEKKLAHLASFPELNPSPVVEVSFEGCIHYLNPAAQKLFPDLQERGHRHEWLADLKSIDSLSKAKEKTFYVREIHVGGVWFEQFFSFMHDQDRIRIYGRDITERKRAEEAMRIAEELARQRLAEIENLYRNAPVGLCVLDRELRWVRINERLAEINGIPAADHVGKRVRELMPELADAVEPGMRRVMETGQPRINIEIISQTPAQPGVTRSWKEQWLPIKDAHGQATGLSIVVEETTESKRAEEELRQSQKDLDCAQEVGQIGSWRLDVHLNVLTWSDENHRIFGIPKGTPMTYETFLSTVYPDDREYVDSSWIAGLAGKPYDIEHRIVVDGKTKWVREKAYLEFNNNGGLMGGFGITQEITERKQAEESLRKSRERFELLSETAGRLLATDKPQEIVDELCQKVMEHLDCHACFNYLVDEETQRLHLNAYTGIPEATAKEIEWLDYGVAVCGCAARDACRIVAEDIPNTPDPRTDLVKSFGIKAYACHPLFSAGRVSGTLSFGTRSRGTFDEEELSLMKTVADQVAMAMERMRLYENGQRLLGEIRKSRDELEVRVQERTQELASAVEVLRDEVSERMEVEASLKERETLLRTVFETLPVGVWLADKQGRIVHGNPAGQKIWAGARYVGIDQLGEYKGWWVETGRRIEADDWAIARAVKHGETSINEEIEIECFDGSHKIILNSAAPIRDERQEIIGAFIVNQDISERRKAQKTAEAERKRFNDVLELLPAYLVLLTPDYHVRFANRFFRDRFGESGGRRCFEYLFGRNEPCEVCENYTPLKTQASHNWKWTGPDSRNYDVFDFSLTDTDGSALILEMGIDVTEQKQAEEALMASSRYVRSLIEASLDPLVTISPDGKVTDVNRATELVTGVSREKLIGSDFSMYFTEPEKAREGYETVFSKGSVRDYPLAIRHTSGVFTDVLYNATIYKNEAGEVQGVFAAARDISEQKKAEKALRNAEDRLRQMQKMEALGTLAGGIAHDFNNILMPILINTELALFDVPPESPVANSLQLVLSAANRGKEMVKQITTFSRMRVREHRPVKIATVVKEALTFIHSSLPKHIEIREEIRAESSMVAADPTQIQQILMNLCGNAADAMRENGGLLRVTLEEMFVSESMVSMEPGLRVGPYVQLTVSDTGTGISPDVIEKVFDPFFTTKDPAGGTGMGLPMVHGIVKSHGGVVTALSEVGKGSVFKVYLPRVETDSADDSPDESPILTGKETILVVDDEEFQVQSMKEMLGRLGYHVSGETRSLEALELFRTQPQQFDLVITDEVMPVMTGSKLAQELLKIRSDLPIILYTGYSEAISADKVRKIGIRELMMKPFGIKEIARTMRKVLDAKTV